MEESQAQRQRPPVVIVGGDAATVSLIRVFARNGISCYLLTRPELRASRSRFAQVLPYYTREAWEAFMLGEASDFLRGALVIAGDDDVVVRFLARHRERLSEKFLLDLMDPAATGIMLDKLKTYEFARARDVPVPAFWPAGSVEDAERVRGQLVYPLLLKPLFSPSFREVFKQKFFVARCYDEVISALDRIAGRPELAVVLLEMIPGPDSLIATYYSYVDETGRCLFDFTKTILRRYPVNGGYATYHISRPIPDVVEVGKRFLEGSNYRGIAGVEFKYDLRDQSWKLMECNARFTSPTELLHASNCNLGMLVYNRAVGLTVDQYVQDQRATRLWLPYEDFLSFLMLKERGEIDLAGWLRSLLPFPHLPFFSWTDPMPSLTYEARRAVRALQWAWKKLA